MIGEYAAVRGTLRGMLVPSRKIECALLAAEQILGGCPIRLSLEALLRRAGRLQ